MEPVTFRVRGITIEGVRWPRPASKDGAAGPTVLLVHGLAGSTIEWESVGAGLAQAVGADVFAVDLPGFGRTRLPRGRSSIPSHTDAVRGVLHEVGDAVLVGNSMGGIISMRVAAADTGSVRALVLVDPALVMTGAGGGASPVRTAARYALALTPVIGPAVIGTMRRRAGAEGYIANRLAGIVKDPSRVAPEVRSRLVEQAAERSAYRESSRCYSSSARSIFTGARSSWREVSRVQVPTFVMHGVHDALVPVGLVDRLRSMRPDWHYEVVEDAGHQPHLELPEHFVASVAAWITTHAGPRS